jgi:hypothetical protein
MRIRLVPVAVAVAVTLCALGVAPFAIAGGSSPSVRGSQPATSLSGPAALQRQTTAGFYEYGRGTSSGRRAVAYVVPVGQSDRMPAGIRRLPVVRSIEKHTDQFGLGTVVIFDAGASLFVPDRSTAHPRALPPDAYHCSDNYFCLYSCGNWDLSYPPRCTMVQFGAFFTGKGWQRLGDYGFNDKPVSMRNRRDLDSLLAKDWPAGNSTRYCAESHSSDRGLTNNPIGTAQASSFANVPDDIHC